MNKKNYAIFTLAIACAGMMISLIFATVIIVENDNYNSKLYKSTPDVMLSFWDGYDTIEGEVINYTTTLECDPKSKYYFDLFSGNIDLWINKLEGWFVYPDKYHILTLWEKRLLKSIIRDVIKNKAYNYLKDELKNP